MALVANRELLYDPRYIGTTKSRIIRAILIQCSACSNEEFKNLPAEVKKSLVWDMESSCYYKACEFSIDNNITINWENPIFLSVYNSICYKIQFNLEYDGTEDSKYLIKKIISGDIDSKQVANIESYELRPSATQKFRDIIELRNKQELKKTVHHTIVCPSCKRNKTTITEIQTRAGDEASTILVQCVSDGCSKRWTLR